MTRLDGQSIPITDGATWLHLPSGRYWREDRFHRGRVVLKLYGTVSHEVRMYRPESDPGTGGAVLGAPYWIRRPRAEAIEALAAR